MIIDYRSIESHNATAMSTLDWRMSSFDLSRLTAGVPLLAAALLAACGGGASNTAHDGPGSGGSLRGSGAATPGGSAGNEAGTTAGGGSGSGSGGDDAATVCPALSEFTLAIHVVVDVSWPDTLGAEGGSGKMHAWNLARMTVDGAALNGMTQPCGSDLPELTLKPLAGGGKFDIEVPDAVWDSPSAPQVAGVGTLDGFDVGSTLSTEVTSLLVGLTLTEPDGPWPQTHAEITTVDADGDGKPGFTGVPKSGSGYVLPPLIPPLIGAPPTADQVYMVSRTAMGLSGTLTSCTEQSGTVTVTFFDNHIVGCHVTGGDDCAAADVDFLDANRTMITATGGTFTSKLVPDTTTCADARGM
jgi:hypothetical protein